MARTVYEGMFILDSGQYGRDPETVSGQIPRMIQQCGGKVLVSRLWDERRLAYPIRGHRKGTYWLTYFQIDGGKIAQLTRKCQLTHAILRHLFVKIDPRIVDALVAHALSGQAGPTAGHPARKGPESEEASEKTSEGDQEAPVAQKANEPN